MPSKRVFVTVSSDLATDNRVHRSCALLKDLGYSVFLIGREKKDSPAMPKRDYPFKRFKLLFEKGALFYATLNIRLFIFLLLKRIDFLFANDLDTLPAAFLISKLKRIPIIYDSHELFTEVPELIARPKIQSFWLHIEKRILPHLKYVLTVNESIAEIFRKKYNIQVAVVRNVPFRNQHIIPLSKAELQLGESTKMIIIQGSGLNVDRGIEEAVLAMKSINNAVLFLVGSGDVIPKVKQLVRENELNDKVRFIGRLPYQEMLRYTAAADLGLAMDKPLSLNYALALPNKVFDYIQANTPILTGPLKEIERIVLAYNCGEIIQKIDPEEIASAVNKLFENPNLLDTYKKNCAKAAEIEHWEKDAQVLQQVILNAYRANGVETNDINQK
jgi:glycosyltransferase involved in cell wall biosynthesis